MRNAKVTFVTESDEPPADTGLAGRKLTMELVSHALSNGRDSPRRSGKRARSSSDIPRFQYSPYRALDSAGILKGADSSVLVEVSVPAHHISPKNDGLRKRLLWGGCRRIADPPQYTDDSDVVAMLLHGGHILLPKSGLPPYDALIVTLRVSPVGPGLRGRGGFPSTEGHGIRSQAWEGAYSGGKVAIEKVMSTREGVYSVVTVPVVNVVPQNVPGVVPWNGPPKEIGGREIGWETETMTFDMTNRPCFAYNIGLVCDRGFDKSIWPSRRLWNELLYLETADNKRFEIAKVPAPDKDPKETDGVKEKRRGLYVRFGQVTKQAITRDLFEKDMPIAMGPLDTAELEEGFSIQKWTTIRWDPFGVTVNGVRYLIEKVFFRRIWTGKELKEWQMKTSSTVQKEEQEMAVGKKGSGKKDVEMENVDKDISDKEDVVSNHSGKTSPKKKTSNNASSEEEEVASKAPDKNSSEEGNGKRLSEKKSVDTGSSEEEDVMSKTADEKSTENTSSDKEKSGEDNLPKLEKKNSDKKQSEKKSGDRKERDQNEKKNSDKNDSPARDSKKRGAEDLDSAKKESKKQRMEAADVEIRSEEPESSKIGDEEQEDASMSDEVITTKEDTDSATHSPEQQAAEKKEETVSVAADKKTGDEDGEKKKAEMEVDKKESKKNSAGDADAEQKNIAKTGETSDSKKTESKKADSKKVESDKKGDQA